MNQMQSRLPEPQVVYMIPGRLEVLDSKDIEVHLQEIMHPYLNTHVVKFIVTHEPTGVYAECSRSTNAKKNREDAIHKLALKLGEHYDELDRIESTRKVIQENHVKQTSSLSSSSSSRPRRFSD